MSSRPPPPPKPPAPPPPASRQHANRSRPPPPSLSSDSVAYFDESKLPSRKDNISVEDERLKRRRTCRFIDEAGRSLALSRIPVATAMVFFHRFYAKHSFAEHDRFEVAIACILLAAKTEEAPKKLSQVIQKCYQLKNRKPGKKIELLDTKGDEFLRLKERTLLLERVILHTIAFELSIDHPYKPLIEQVKKMNPTQNQKIEYIDKSKNSKELMNELVQKAMSMANDSLYTSLCLQHHARQIAMACIFISAKMCGIRSVDGKSWTELLNIDVEILTCKLFVNDSMKKNLSLSIDYMFL